MGRALPAACLAAALIVACAAAFAAEEPLAPSASPPGPAAQRPAAELPERATSRDREATGIELGKLRLREGSRLLDVPGRFRQIGDSLTFIDDEDREIGGLPNLNLERIIRILKTVEEPESITWSVSGTVTEFSGRNYLLISRAIYKAAAPPPTPEGLFQPASEPKP